jgi:hypothetical protein
VLHKVSTVDSVAISPYPTGILGWIQKGDKLPLITIQSELMESGQATAKARGNRVGEHWATWHGVGAVRRAVLSELWHGGTHLREQGSSAGIGPATGPHSCALGRQAGRT